MARQARYDSPGTIHHIMNRGFHGNPIFINEEIYKYYLNCFDQFKTYDYKIISYCFMPNHSHILLQTGKVHLSKIMKDINSRFASYWKKVNKKNGPVFQGRFKSKIVGTNNYLKLVSRYIHRNPLKAGLTESLGKYSWSSYPLLLRKKHPEWYDDTILLKLFSSDWKKAVKKYREFVRKRRKEDELNYPVHCWGQIVAGSQNLYEKILEEIKLNRRKKVKDTEKRYNYSGSKTIRKMLAENKLTKGKLQHSLRKDVIKIRRKLVYLLKYYCHWDSSKIQDKLKIKKMTLSRDIRQIEHKLKIRNLKKDQLVKYLMRE